jgi:phosphate transport system permease protein
MDRFLDKENYNIKNILSSITIIISLIMIILGFNSLSNQFYIGDFNLQLLLSLLSIFLIFQCAYAFFISEVRKKLIPMIIFTIIVIIITILLPSFPPKYDLRNIEITASIMKFLIVSVLNIIIGVFGVSYSLKPMYNFTSKSKQYSAYFILILSILLILIPLFIIVSNIVVNGAGGISWEFITQDVRSFGEEGGVFKALIGTICLIAGVTIIAIPLGVSSAIYLTEYAKEGIIVRIIRITVDILQGVPSIVFGLFGLALLVPIFGISLFNGIVVLSFLTLPIVIRASEEAILSVPKSIREGSYALGATKWQTIRRVVLPPAIPGIITGGVLGLARAAGETAPIMFVACVWIGAPSPPQLFEPIQSLPYHLLSLIYKIGAWDVEPNAWAAAFLLIGIVLSINAFSIIIREKYRVEF